MSELEEKRPIQNQQSILSNVQVGGDLRVGNITQVIQDSLSLPKDIPQNLPARGITKFIGNEKTLLNLTEALHKKQEVAISAITGMGGIGKTELALQYAYLNLQRETYPGGICWIHAIEQDIGLQIVNFAQTGLNLSPPDDLDLPDRVYWCWKHWKEGNTLIVFDDVKDYSDIKPYLPPQVSQFKVLITTRLHLDLPQSVSLDVLTEEESLDLLGQYIGKEKINQQLLEAKELCSSLGYLPLALDLVGRYIKTQNISLADMLRKLEEKGLEHKSLNIANAFELTWQQMNAKEQRLGYLLGLFSLAPIQWSLVEQCFQEKNAEQLEEARINLFSLSLLNKINTDTWQLHPLIREFFNRKLENFDLAEVLKKRFCQVMTSVAKEIPYTHNLTYQEITTIEPAIPHLEEAATVLIQWIENEDIVWLFTGLGRFYESQGDYRKAENWYNQCLSIISSRLNEDDPDYILSLNNLAFLYKSQGRYDEAESLFLKILDLRKQLFGDEHLDTAISLNNLALLYKSQGRYDEAESLFLETIKLYRQLLGEEHPYIASNLNNVAHLFYLQGKYEAAEPLYLQALEIRRRLQGEQHPVVAQSLNNLALLYESQGRYEAAEPLYLQALEARKYLLGEQHPDVASSLNNLASLYYSQGRYKAAEPLYLQALELSRKLLGDDHPDVATSLNNLASLYSSQGRYGEAEPLYLQALEINKKLLGEQHPSVASSLNNLANLYYSQGRYEEAEPLLLEALELSRKLLGDDHPDVATSLNNLASLYYSQGRYKAAEPLYLQALEINRKLLGEEHPYFASSLSNLANLYYSQGRYEEAEPLYLQALELYKQSLGENHPQTVAIWKNFVGFLIKVVKNRKESDLSQNVPWILDLMNQIKTNLEAD